MAYLGVLLLVGCGSNKNQQNDNPFFSEFDTKFGVPAFDKIEFKHYQPAFEEGMKRHQAEIDSIVNNSEEPTFENTIEKYDMSGEMLTNVATVFYNLTSANTDESMQKLAQEIAPKISKHSDDIMLNEKLFSRIKSVYEKRENLNAEQKKLTETIYLDFVRSGANLDAENKKRLREINERLSLLELKFGDNVLADNNAFEMVIDKKEDLAGLPQSIIDAAAEDANAKNMKGKWLFTVNKPSMIPFLQYSEKRELREKIYRGYFMRGDNDNKSDNKKNVEEIVALRLERAKLLGYDNHASFILDRNMAKTPEKVYELLMTIWDAALPVAKAEAAEMQKMIDKEGGNFKLAPWDWWYYAEKIRKEKYDLDEEMLRPYFSLDNVREGIFTVCNKLYGITFEKLEGMPIYHKDVVVYEVLDTNKQHLAVLYMDFHPRASKRGGAWCTSYREQHVKNGKNIAPVVSLVMNFTAPTANTPALLNLDETLTFFHEFGHAVHVFFGDVTYRRLSGYVPRDFVELPSQVMEHWALQPEVLKLYAKHYKTGEVIPDELIEKIKNSSNFNQGFGTTEIIAAALLDMDFHTIEKAENIKTNDFEKASMAKIGLIDEILPRYRATYFNHIFSGGYSAGYYSYLWSEVLDADAFAAFEESGDVFNKELAKKFRDNVLAPGGKRDPMEMYVSFRGREPKVDALLKNRGLK
ncbi:MAG: M3 family metallopeptidase [Bacteroidales bacterium]|nr:M3 family metallopeptidase [Bacteroidales bacterium]